MINPSTQRFRHDIVNDLAFAIFAPSMLSHDQAFTVAYTDKRQQWLCELDNNPQALLDACSIDQRLGHYHEALWGFFFTHDEQFTLLAQNLQVFDGKITVGEFDFILKNNQTQNLIHLEVAAKYYLFYSSDNSIDSSNAKAWPGPNSQDNLGKKISSLLSKQSKLSVTEAGKKTLSNKLGIDAITAMISLKGYLFHQSQKPQQLPQHVQPQHATNLYYYSGQLTLNEELFIHIPKARWLSQTHSMDSINKVDKAQAKQMVERRNTPLLFATAKLQNRQWIEQQRFFICPEKWPKNMAC